jgi:DNA-binding transcriptional ArsR family regulator
MTDTGRLGPDEAEQLAGWLKLLANANRLQIVGLLAQGERTVAEIEAALGIRQPSLSQQLGVLREGGLIRAERQAKTVVYALDEAALAPVVQLLCERLAPGTGEPAASVTGGPRSQAAMFATLGGSR